MHVHHGLDAVPRLPGCVLTMGTFDGVHAGHAAVMAETVRRAGQGAGTGHPARPGHLARPSVVLTYDPHPRAVLFGQGPPLLTTLAEKTSAIAHQHVEHLVVVPFTKELAAWSAERFVDEVLVQRLGAGEVVLGHDHRFGAYGRGDAALLRTLGAARGFSVDEVPPLEVGGRVVSSSAIRALLAAGDVSEAATLLGRRFTLSGTVVRGDQIGRTLGYPTANLAPDAGKIVPGHGVYALRVQTEDGAWHGGLASLGTRPTFGGEDVRVEAHLLDFSGDLYGQRLTLEFVRFLRPEQRFDGVDALVRQMDEDAVIGRQVLAALS